ncbi:MAG: hypothetical protein ACOZCK_12835 [Pseudomonadota bacterium]
MSSIFALSFLATEGTEITEFFLAAFRRRRLQQAPARKASVDASPGYAMLKSGVLIDLEVSQF